MSTDTLPAAARLMRPDGPLVAVVATSPELAAFLPESPWTVPASADDCREVRWFRSDDPLALTFGLSERGWHIGEHVVAIVSGDLELPAGEPMDPEALPHLTEGAFAFIPEYARAVMDAAPAAELANIAAQRAAVERAEAERAAAERAGAKRIPHWATKERAESLLAWLDASTESRIERARKNAFISYVEDHRDPTVIEAEAREEREWRREQASERGVTDADRAAAEACQRDLAAALEAIEADDSLTDAERQRAIRAARLDYDVTAEDIASDRQYGEDRKARLRAAGLLPPEPDDDGPGAGAPPQDPASPPASALPAARADDPYAGLYDVPGLVGDIMRWTIESSQRPIPLHALGAALAVVGTAAGRQFIGPTYSGTHLYVLGLAPTAGGKNHSGACLMNIMIGAGMEPHTGSAMPKSGAAMTSELESHPLSVYLIDEFGDFLNKINSTNSGAHLAEIATEFKKLWGSSFQPYKTPNWAQKKSVMIHSPAVSIYGMTTAAAFYDALSSNDVKGGLLNRFLVLEAIERGRTAKPSANPLVVPQSIIDGVRSIYGAGDVVSFARDDISKPVDLKVVPWGDGAEALYEAAVSHAERISDEQPDRGDYYGRSAEMALRIATILAIGINPANPVITASDMAWSIRLVSIATKRLFERADLYVSDNLHQAQYNLVRRIIADSKGWIARQAVTKKVKGRFPTKVTESILEALVEAGEVEKLVGERGPNGKCPVTFRIAPKSA